MIAISKSSLKADITAACDISGRSDPDGVRSKLLLHSCGPGVIQRLPVAWKAPARKDVVIFPRGQWREVVMNRERATSRICLDGDRWGDDRNQGAERANVATMIANVGWALVVTLVWQVWAIVVD